MIRIAVAFMAAAAPAAAQVNSGDIRIRQVAAPRCRPVELCCDGGRRRGPLWRIICRLCCDKATRTRDDHPARRRARRDLTIVTDTPIPDRSPPNGRLSAFDPLLDAMAFSRGRFLVGGGSSAVLAIPSWPEAAREHRGLSKLTTITSLVYHLEPQHAVYAIKQRKEVIRCLMVQQRGRSSSLGG